MKAPRIRSLAAAAALTAAVTGGALAAATPVAANTGYDVCVQAGTPVETGPGGTTVYAMAADQVWHVYGTADNQWTSGYVSLTDPTVRGWVWSPHFDGSRVPTQLPAGGASC